MRLFFNGISQVPLNHRLLFLMNQSKSNKRREFTHGYLAVAAKDLVCAIIPFGTLGREGRTQTFL